MKTRWTPILLIIAGAALTGGPVWSFWPNGTPGSYFYEAPDGRLLEVRISKYSFVKIFTDPNHPDDVAAHYLERDYMQYDPSGDVVYLGQEMGLLSRTSLEYARSFYPEAVFLDLPLEVGKTWIGDVGVSPDLAPAFMTYNVTGVEELVTTLGTFPVTVLEVTNTAEYLFKHAGVYKLHEELGPIELPGGYLLVDVDGQVAVEESTWGELKSLYR